MVGLVAMAGDAATSLPETLEPACCRLPCAASLAVFDRVWLIWFSCGDDAGETDDLGGGLACWCMIVPSASYRQLGFR